MYLPYTRTGSRNVSLTQQNMRPAGEETGWRETARRLQISRADTDDTDCFYNTLYEADQVKSKYIRVIYLHLPVQLWGTERDNPQFKEEADGAKMISWKLDSETMNWDNKELFFLLNFWPK